MTAAAAPGGSTGGDDASLAKEEGPPRKRGRIAQSAEDDAGGSGARAPLEFALEPDEYAIALDMTGKAGLGLDVDWADGKTLLIKALKKEGAISDWNRRRPPTEAVEAGDQIVSINGKIYDTEAMLAECRSKHKLHVVIRTPREPPPKGDAWAGRLLEYDVELDLDKKPGLGLDVDWADGKTLFIKAVKPEGAIPDWNKRSSEREAVRAGDRIVSINGKAGDPKAMLAEVKKKGRVQLTVKAGAQPQESPVPPPREKPAGERGGGGAQAAAEAAPRPPPGPTKAHEFVVWADMGRYTALGIDVSWEDGRTLFVNEVKGGAVQEWNSGHLPHQQVAAGDRVVAVNGYSGDGERMAELCRELADAQGRVLLHVRGPPPPPPPESKRPAGKSAPSAEEEQKKEKREKKDKKAKEDKEEKGTNDKSDEGKKDKDDTKEDKKHKKERKEKKDK